MVSQQKLRDALEVQEPDEFGYLADLEARAVAHIERQTGRYFRELQQTTEYVVALGTRNLWLVDPPAVGPAVTVVDVLTGETVASADYTVRGTKLVHGTGRWVLGREYAVTYTRGYASTSPTPTSDDDIDAPAEIRGLVEWLVAEWYEERIPIAAVEMRPLPFHALEVLEGFRRQVYA